MSSRKTFLFMSHDTSEDQPTAAAQGKPKYVKECACVSMAEAKMTNQAQWESIPLVAKEINLQLTLSSGQAFRWVRLEEDVWAGTIGERWVDLNYSHLIILMLTHTKVVFSASP